jgi:alpha-aminoadipate/glutamate carrier protein LysW
MRACAVNAKIVAPAIDAEGLAILNSNRRVQPVRRVAEDGMVQCPECESDLDIEIDEVDEGDIISCPECGTDFEVITTHPLELNRVAEEEGEDDEDKEEEGEDGDYS